MKLLTRILLGLAILILGFVVYNMQSGFRSSDKKTLAYFKKRTTVAKIKTLPYADGQLHWIETERDTLSKDAPLVLFVHGAPGSARDFFQYQADSILLNRAVLVSIDRPGYGYSLYGKAMTSISDQAKAVKAVMDQYPGRKVVLVGHSYGGPIVAKTAAVYPERIQSVVMLAPVNDPDNEPIFWFSYIGKWAATRWMLSGAWRVSGAEKFSHATELDKMRGDWFNLQASVMHLHGPKDMLAPPSNIDFSEKNIHPRQLKMIVKPEWGHLIPFMNPDDTRKAILEALGTP